LLAILMMIVGVSLFVRMVQVLFRPRRVHQRCPSCGLSEHESDAVYWPHAARLSVRLPL
jgi:voltage-gated potassium channel